MGRSALDQDFKAARLARARAQATKMNASLPRNVYAFAVPSGKVCIRFEPPGGQKIILRQPFPSIEFDQELLDYRKGTVPRRLPLLPTGAVGANLPPIPGTWRWLCLRYFESAEFGRYTARDQRVRRSLLLRTCDAPIDRTEPNGLLFGEAPLSKFQTKAILVLKERFACYGAVSDAMFPDDPGKVRQLPSTPEAANSVVKYIRLVFAWALTAHTDAIGGRNWAREVRLFPPGGGHRTWMPQQCAAYEAAHLTGTLKRLVYDIAKFTGQRLSDVARMGNHMIDRTGNSPKIRFVQAKGRGKDPVTAFIPLFPELQMALEAANRAGVLGTNTFIAQSNGRAYTSESLGNMFREACKDAGLEGFSMHGLRKTGVVNLIRANCDFFQIMAITGHRSKKEIERYGREYMREIACEAAFEKWLASTRLTDASRDRTLSKAV